jgi:SIR2-like domain
MNEQRKDTIQGCNINFLLGSGLSCPYLKALGKVELLLTQVENSNLDDDKKKLVTASLYKCFFDGVISRNLNVLAGDAAAKSVLEGYKDFLRIWNSILLRRKSTILSKEVNLFTTNVDIFLDKALEDLGLEYNDGFNGRFRPTFSLSNFKKSRFKKSLHFDNTAEIPVFNLLKLHGSLTWETELDEIRFSRDLKQVGAIAATHIATEHVLDVPNDATLESLMAATDGKSFGPSTGAFIGEYEKLLIVNPTKDKFKDTLIKQTYYEHLRIYSNELEKENTVLYVLGFSFADEHIREITLRAANSNPTLLINVLAYSSDAKADILAHFDLSKIKNNNIKFIAPPQSEAAEDAPITDKFNYNLANINKEFFGCLFKEEEEAEKDAAPIS